MTENKKSFLKASAEHTRNFTQALGSRLGTRFNHAKTYLIKKINKSGTLERSTLTSLDFKKSLKSFQEVTKNAIENFDPQAAMDWATRALQKPNTAFYGTLATVTLSSLFAADLTSLVVGEYIPPPPPVRSRILGNPTPRQKSISDYGPIISRNLFNSNGVIGGEDKENPSDLSSPNDLGGTPTKSMLPLTLIGTLVLEDELRSIATIEDKSASTIYPVRVEDEIPNKIKVLKIEANRVTFLNKSSGRREFLEIIEENPSNPRLSLGKNLSSGGPGIEKVAPTQYSVSRLEVDKALADFNNVLTQARAVPNIENGMAAGYKLFQIVPGSIYDKLGLQNGDVILGLNGTPINDPAKAFEMLSELKSSNHLELQLRKDGSRSSQTYSYDIH